MYGTRTFSVANQAFAKTLLAFRDLLMYVERETIERQHGAEYGKQNHLCSSFSKSLL